METAIILACFAPSLIPIGLLVGLLIGEIAHQKRNKQTEEILQKCIAKKGYDFVRNVLEIAANSNFNHKYTMSFLQNACEIQ